MIEQRIIDMNVQSVRFIISVLEMLSLEATKTDIAKPAEELADKGPLETKKERVRLGMYSIQDFMVIADAIAKKQNISTFKQSEMLWGAVLKRLIKFGYVLEAPRGLMPEFQILEFFAAINALLLVDNVVFGTAYMVNARRKAIPAINVMSGNGDAHCGSGLLLGYETKVGFRKGILTNRHVLEGNEISEVVGDGFRYELDGRPVWCDFADLAIIPVIGDNLPMHFLLSSGKELLSTVISVGYPLVPTAAAQYALCHKGEINGVVKNTLGQEFLAISNHVSPGNSGGPLLTEEGYCAGVVAQSGIADFGAEDSPLGTYRSTYHMAISSDTILQFLSSLND